MGTAHDSIAESNEYRDGGSGGQTGGAGTASGTQEIPRDISGRGSRNLLERMRDYENEILRFMTEAAVPFTNNQAERDIRMAKVQQKISGSFRSWDGAYYFSRIRSYISTCEKNGVSAAEALNLLLAGKLPDFIFNSA